MTVQTDLIVKTRIHCVTIQRQWCSDGPSLDEFEHALPAHPLTLA